jgi:hypothetical protein
MRIGSDHFARPNDDLAAAYTEGRLHRNFQIHTTDPTPALLGFGASAIGSLPQGYFQNTPPLTACHDAVTLAEFATERGIALNANDHLRHDIIDRLMYNMAVHLKTGCKAYGMAQNTLDDEMERLSPLAEDGIVEVDGGCVTVTDERRPFVRLVAAAFDRYLNKGEMRPSKAVYNLYSGTFAGQGQAVADRHHADAHPLVVQNLSVEGHDGFGVLAIHLGGIHHTAAPQNVVYTGQATWPKKREHALEIVFVFGLVSIDEGEVEGPRLARRY